MRFLNPKDKYHGLNGRRFVLGPIELYNGHRIRIFFNKFADYIVLWRLRQLKDQKVRKNLNIYIRIYPIYE